MYANRRDMIRQLSMPTDRVGEIGVLWGVFSEVLIKSFRPRQFVAFDLFNYRLFYKHYYLRRLIAPIVPIPPNRIARPNKQIITESEYLEGGKQTHLDYYKKRIGSLGAELICQKGKSCETLFKRGKSKFRCALY